MTRHTALVEQDVVVENEQLNKLAFVLDDRKTDQGIGLGRTEEGWREHDRHVLSAHHVLMLVLRHSDVHSQTQIMQTYDTINVKTSQFITQCKGDISHAFKTAKIIVFDPMMCPYKTSCCVDHL